MRDIGVGKIVGLSGDGWWAQVHDFTPEDVEKEKILGRLVAVVSIKVGTDNTVDVVNTGREVLTRLHELYYGGSEAEATKALRGAATRLNEEYPGVELAGMVFVGEVMHVAAINGTKVWITEGGQEGWLVKRGEEGKVTILSGKSRGGMVLVAGNERFWRELPEGVVRAVTARESEKAEDLGEALGGVLFGRRKSEGEAGVVIKISEGVAREEMDSPDAADEVGPVTEETPEVMAAEEEEVSRQEDRKVVLGGLMSRAKDMWGDVKSKFPSGPAYVIQAEDNPNAREAARKRTRQIGVAFLILAVVLFGGGRLVRRSTDQTKIAADGRIEEIVNKYTEAKALVGLNQIRARQMLTEVRSSIDGLDEKTKKDDRIVMMLSEYGEVLGAASGIKQTEGQEVVDLNLVRENMTGLTATYGEGKLWVVANDNRVVEIDPGRKNGEVQFGEADMGRVRFAAAYPGRIYGWAEDGVRECPVPSGDCAKKIDKDDEWGEITDMEVWAANIYLLDRSKGEIWRYAGGEAGFGARQQWLKETDVSLVGSQSMTIDGSIWVVSGGGIAKYTQGVKEGFSVAGLDKSFGGGAKIYTDENSDNVYVLDASNRRVVSITKESGEYEGQWEWDKMGEATDLVVDERAKKMYLMGGRYIWEVVM